jgi:hypothetical protein
MYGKRLLSIAAVAVWAGLTPSTAPAANDWRSRIAGTSVPGGAASILGFQDFDKFPATSPQEYFRTYDPTSITTDCKMAADGCSLKFSILPGYQQGEPGWFDWNFTRDLSRTFGPGTEFYVQYRERVDAAMLTGANFPNGEGWKQDIVTEGDSPTVQAPDCSNSPGEVVTIQSSNRAYPVLYSNCGYSGGAFAFMRNSYQAIQLGGIAGSNFLDQNATGCPHYFGRATPTTTCWLYAANEWMTVQVHVRIGDFNKPNSVVELWMAHDGKPAELVINAMDAALVNDGAGRATGRYGKIQLSAYNTNMSGALVPAAVWFDDLVAATRRLPDPNVATPNPPDGLQLSNVGAKSVTVEWRVNSQNGAPEDDTGFRIERATGGGATVFPSPQPDFAEIGRTAPGASRFVDKTVLPGKTYTYRVRATNAAGQSAYAIAQCFNNDPESTCGGTVVVPTSATPSAR